MRIFGQPSAALFLALLVSFPASGQSDSTNSHDAIRTRMLENVQAVWDTPKVANAKPEAAFHQR